MAVKLKRIILLFGDIALFYLSLYATLFLRYGGGEAEIRDAHLFPFTILFAISILVFYIVPAFGITPKPNLFIFFLIASSASYTWRTFWNRIAGFRAADKRLLLIGSNRILEEVAKHIHDNPQLGY